jgi:hypothetical protein
MTIPMVPLRVKPFSIWKHNEANVPEKIFFTLRQVTDTRDFHP